MTSVQNLIFRRGRLSDLEEMQQLFVATIESVCSSEYNHEQIQAWVSGVDDEQRWLDMLTHQFVLVAILGGCLAGYGSLGNGGYVDMLYVHKDFQGKSIATSILNRLEEEAVSRSLSRLHSDVSKTAKGFFEKLGFKTVKEQITVRQGVEMVNYKMVKDLVNR